MAKAIALQPLCGSRRAGVAECSDASSAPAGADRQRQAGSAGGDAGMTETEDCRSKCSRNCAGYSSTSISKDGYRSLPARPEMFDALDKAFDYRGDVTLTLKNGERFEAYIFDRRPGAIAGAILREAFSRELEREACASRTARLRGWSLRARIAPPGKHWEAWVKQYKERKPRARSRFGLHPEVVGLDGSFLQWRADF